MAGLAHPEAMSPPKPGRTRTAPPEMPSSWWRASRIRNYLLFDATGIIYFLLAFLGIEIVWALGSGPEAYEQVMGMLTSPAFIAFHAFSFVCVVYVGVRFFSLFPKAQPRDTGLPMPPLGAIKGLLYVIWIGLTVILSAVLAGGIF